MFERLHNRLWIRPQLLFVAWLSSAWCECQWEIPEVIFNKKGALAGIVGITDMIFCSIALEIFSKYSGRYKGWRWEDSKRCESVEKYIEDKGLIRSGVSSADMYYYLKNYISLSRKYLSDNGRNLEQEDIDYQLEKIEEAEAKMKEVYEDALILELAGVEKGF